jgi:hypothetical protein
MIIKYRETSEAVEIHSHAHNVCTHELEDGWECLCSECQCESIIKIHAAYAYDYDRDHKVIIETNPGEYRRNATIALPANVARALAAALNFAANDADTLNKEFPN